MKLLKTIRFDGSDERVFDKAAEPGEWAVSGAFAFADRAANSLTGKTRQAFANGFLGVTSFGRATFASVAHARADERQGIEHLLAQHFVTGYGAPDLDAALPAAKEEVSFVEDLCRNVPVNTVFAVRRTWGADGGIEEEFRTITPPSGPPPHAKIWTATDDDA